MSVNPSSSLTSPATQTVAVTSSVSSVTPPGGIGTEQSFLSPAKGAQQESRSWITRMVSRLFDYCCWALESLLSYLPFRKSAPLNIPPSTPQSTEAITTQIPITPPSFSTSQEEIQIPKQQETTEQPLAVSQPISATLPAFEQVVVSQKREITITSQMTPPFISTSTDLPISSSSGSYFVGTIPSSGGQQPLDVNGMLAAFSKSKQRSLEWRLERVLSDRLGDRLDNKEEHFSGSYITGMNSKGQEQVTGVLLTSLKKAFLNVPLFDEIINLKNNMYSEKRGLRIAYTLESLRRTHEWKRKIATSTPDLDPLIQVALKAAVIADGEYEFGFELDMAETRKQNQLVFSIFEREGTKEISRIQVLECEL